MKQQYTVEVSDLIKVIILVPESKIPSVGEPIIKIEVLDLNPEGHIKLRASTGEPIDLELDPIGT